MDFFEELLRAKGINYFLALRDLERLKVWFMLHSIQLTLPFPVCNLEELVPGFNSVNSLKFDWIGAYMRI